MYATISNVLQSNFRGWSRRVGDTGAAVRGGAKVMQAYILRSLVCGWGAAAVQRVLERCKRWDVNKLISLQEIPSSVCVYILCARFFFQIHFFRDVERERERECVIVQQQRRAMPRNALYITVGETDAPLQLRAAYLHCDSSDSDVWVAACVSSRVQSDRTHGWRHFLWNNKVHRNKNQTIIVATKQKPGAHSLYTSESNASLFFLNSRHSYIVCLFVFIRKRSFSSCSDIDVQIVLK